MFTHFWKEGSGLFCMSSLLPPPLNPLEDELLTAESIAPPASVPFAAAGPWPELCVCVIILSNERISAP